jgi:hypothetical protein
MTTMALTVAAIRRMLKDAPVEDPLAASVTDTTGIIVTVTNIGLYAVGQVVEPDDGATGAEQWYVRSVDTVNSQIGVKRGHNGSTATTHNLGTTLLLKPRFPYDEIAQAVNFALDVDFYPNDVYEVVEHAITSSATTNTYQKPTASCMVPLSLSQQLDPTDEPLYLRGWTKRYYDIDIALYSTGGYIAITGNYGVAGVDVYYLNCAHRLTIGTVTDSQARGLEMMACYYLLTWEDIRRTAGPTNQGDRTVRPLDSSRLGAAFYKDRADQILRDEANIIKQTLPPSGKRFVREDIH